MNIQVEYLREKASFAAELGYGDHARILVDAATRIAALEAQLAERVKIKQLRWIDRSGEEYSVRHEGRCGDFVYIAKAVRSNDMILCAGRYYSGIEEAKAAAQADYERRILSALED